MTDQDKSETEKALVLRPEPGPLTAIETFIKGKVKVNGDLLVQAFLSPVEKKGMLLFAHLSQ